MSKVIMVLSVGCEVLRLVCRVRMCVCVRLCVYPCLCLCTGEGV